jgi:hypothetical protein
MSMRFNSLAESISSFLEDEDAWASLLPIGALSIVTLWVTSIFLRASKEHVVRFSVPVPPQLRNDWGLKDEPAEEPPHEDIVGERDVHVNLVLRRR